MAATEPDFLRPSTPVLGSDNSGSASTAQPQQRRPTPPTTSAHTAARRRRQSSHRTVAKTLAHNMPVRCRSYIFLTIVRQGTTKRAMIMRIRAPVPFIFHSHTAAQVLRRLLDVRKPGKAPKHTRHTPTIVLAVTARFYVSNATSCRSSECFRADDVYTYSFACVRSFGHTRHPMCQAHLKSATNDRIKSVFAALDTDGSGRCPHPAHAHLCSAIHP